MQTKFNQDYGGQEVEGGVATVDSSVTSFGDTMKRLNIIDMTGNSLQVQTSKVETDKSATKRAIARNKSNLLLQKVLKVKDQAKFNVKALVQREEYHENLAQQLEQEK